ncbi:metallophosphoesterase family protein [Rhizobium binxianense]|uniref:metallophosphoesterase family protein n=1 Tax=Rhizobium binxianense TaxID=3024242 RepID=UPI00234E5190|nr:metallophosphoesterase [Rhizobium sp. BC56]MDC7743411.1 metallophosphoesterase [Rhizobium sp. BC56]
MPSLIHISDLHRSSDEPIDNDTLLAAIVADVDRFAILNERPDALIVSGDLVQGVRVGQRDFEREMRDQYDVAFDLIGRLCDELLGGDRSKVVVVPGNHDVCWNTSVGAMETVANNSYPQNLRHALGERDGAYRWSWDEQRLYHVSSQPKYELRLACYWDAVENFYRGVGLLLPIDRTRGYHFFQLFKGRMLVAAFESTHRNDHLRYESELMTGVVSRCAMEFRRMGLNPSLLAAVWHHSLQGAPSKEDYLNIETIRQMAGLGFQLGFHGHQHLAESTDLSVSIAGGSTMCLVSAGSLCASWHDLPRGTDRQYNIVRIEPNFERGTLHVREMAEGSQFVPCSRGRFLWGMVPLAWSPRVNAVGGTAALADKELRDLTIEVEEANKKGQQSPATIELLQRQPGVKTYPRKVLLQALQLAENWQAIWEVYWPSDQVEEIVMAAEAAYQMSDLGKLDLVLASGKLPEIFRGDFGTRRNLLKMREGK